jgi:hypothetical protein
MSEHDTVELANDWLARTVGLDDGVECGTALRASVRFAHAVVALTAQLATVTAERDRLLGELDAANKRIASLCEAHEAVFIERDQLLAQTCETCQHNGGPLGDSRVGFSERFIRCNAPGLDYAPLTLPDGQPFGCKAHQPRDPQP